MNKSNHFSGQPTFSQLIGLIPKHIVATCVSSTQSDYYYKKFNTWHHLVTMLFGCYGHCHSLREVISGMRALEGRLQSSSIRHLPARATLADANARRNSHVFELIYFGLKRYWDRLSPDSRKVFIVDSTTIKLFRETFPGAGTTNKNGRRKGGVKVHMAVLEQEFVPTIMHITKAAYNDMNFLKNVNLPMGSTLIMDRGYHNHNLYIKWTDQNIRWITRAHTNSHYHVKKRLPLTDQARKLGLMDDLHIRLGHPAKHIAKVNCRLIKFTSPDTGKYFEFLTNDLTSPPENIADLYKRRWKIEVLFKRLKQNMPLRYFFGDNKNAIEIQIWCALIADLLLQIVIRQIKRKWAFSNVVSIVRLHLFNYLNLFSFLENPEKTKIESKPPNISQLKLHLSG